MREIKFRVWSVQCQQMKYHFLYHGPAPTDLCHVAFPGYEFMQFTGLLDRNGKEIYEGDICSLSSRIDIRVVVCWNAETAAFAARKIIDDGEISDHLFGAEMGEVIGNIYENPELIKEKEGK